MDNNDRKNLLKMFENEPDEKLLFSKVLNQASLCSKNHINCFSDFIDPYRAGKYLSALKTSSNMDIKTKLFGGNSNAERVVIGFCPEYIELADEDFPIEMLKIKYDSRFNKGLSHRDFLGSLIGLGIDRIKIGDIIIDDNKSCAFAYVHKEISDYIIYNLESVGRTKVTVETCAFDILANDEKEAEEITITVSSLRIDTIISNIFKLSRSKALEYISAEKVFINWQPVKSASKQVNDGDTITLRGKGRAKINGFIGKSKKDKFIISVTK